MMDKLVRGTQIIYVPSHLFHKDGSYNKKSTLIQRGFVTSGPTFDGSYFCRFWSFADVNDLRTKNNSELTPVACIVVEDTYPKSMVQEMLDKYC
jgi:hypothetical protein